MKDDLCFIKKISRCKTCDFFHGSMDGMECRHPYWNDKGAYENMIISHDVDIPEECPLRARPLAIRYILAKKTREPAHIIKD